MVRASEKMDCLLMQTADSCFALFGPHQCGVAPEVDQQLLASQQLTTLCTSLVSRHPRPPETSGHETTSVPGVDQQLRADHQQLLFDLHQANFRACFKDLGFTIH